MSFKHDNGRNTDLYKSLEKIARQKGLIEETKLVKSASAKIAPTGFLDENIVNLCSGLRQQGLVSQASDLEKKYLLYKIAKNSAPQDLDPEIMQMAHPLGGTRVSNMAVEAVVEDLIDVHLASLEVALKNPTGQVKYASSKDVLRDVKMVLAQGTDRYSLLREKAKNIVRMIMKKVSDDGREGLVNGNHINQLLSGPIKLDSIIAMEESAKVMEGILEPSFWFESGGLSKDAWNQIKVLFSSLKEVLLAFKEERARAAEEETNASLNNINNVVTIQPPASPLNPVKNDKDIQPKPGVNVTDKNVIDFNNEVTWSTAKLSKWKGILGNDPDFTSQVKEWTAWIDYKVRKIKELNDQFNAPNMNEENKIQLASKYLSHLRALTWKKPNDLETFRKNFGLPQ